MMNRTMPLLALGAMLMMSGCGDSSPSSPDTSNPSAKLLPLAVGNQWLLTASFYDSTGTVTQTRTDTTRIAADTMIQGEQWFFFNDDHATPTANRTDGLYYWDRTVNAARLYVRYPGTAGDSYERGSQRYTVTSNNTTVTVPAGVFTCYQITVIDSNVPNVVGIYSVAPGVGPVKVEAQSKRGDGSMYVGYRSELKSYTLK